MPGTWHFEKACRIKKKQTNKQKNPESVKPRYDIFFSPESYRWIQMEHLCHLSAPINVSPYNPSLISATGSYRDSKLQFSFRLHISLAQKTVLF